MLIIRLLEKHEPCVAGINRLLPQLSASGNVELLTEEALKECFKNVNFNIFIAEDCGKTYPYTFVGMATIFFQRNLGRWIAEIHDVVVDKNYRQRGIGKELVKKLIEHTRSFAKEHDVKLKLYLTSRPSREVANQLYVGLQFTLVAQAQGVWGTNLYKMILAP